LLRSIFLNNSNPSGFRPGPRGPRTRQPIELPDAHRINNRILAREVLVISELGEQLGLLNTRDAVMAAQARGFDLVEVSPNSNPPVCKIMDYGKFKYREQKKAAEAKKNRSETLTKELRMRYSTDKGDLETKLRQAREFLEEGHKVKFSMRFKGREIAYVNLGIEKLTQIIQALSDISIVDEKSPPTGRQIYMVLAPQKKAPAKK
jgi:translation initiation factor IF-3